MMINAPWSAGSACAKLDVPAGAVDCHHHIYDSRFPVDPEADLKPQDATVEHYRILQERLGITRSVVVQPSTYGTDNRCLLDALSSFGDDARGIAVVDPRISDIQLRELDQAGVRGIRFNLARPAGATTHDLETIARRIAPLGWHVQLHALADAYPELEPILQRLPVTIVIDHMGRISQPAGQAHPAWNVLRKLVDAGQTWVKLSGAYHDTENGAPHYSDTSAIAVAWLDMAPERMIWGTDWPHPSAMAGEKPLPDDAVLLDLLETWLPSAKDRHRLLVENPARLYGFSVPGRT